MTNQFCELNLERYKLIRDSFIDSVCFKNNDIYINEKKIDRLDEAIPNFINKDLDDLTTRMSNFYNEVQFPNYDEFDDYASLYDKGANNLFTKRLDDELGYGTKVLELGCGTGQLSLFLSGYNRQVFAVDISDASLILGENFRRNYKIENTFFMKMDVFDLKFKPNTFDIIISNGVLHHTKNAEESFSCLVKVAKPGGLIVIGLYHKYGRLFTRLKQKLAKIIGNKILYLDGTSRRIKSKDKRNAWVKDQFMNPHETLHTPDEILDWFEDNKVEFLNLIPHYSIDNDKLFTKNKKPKISLLDNLLMSINGNQIKEGGFFIMVGRKKK